LLTKRSNFGANSTGSVWDTGVLHGWDFGLLACSIVLIFAGLADYFRNQERRRVSQICNLRTASLLGLLALVWVSAGAALAAEDKLAPRGAPGILVEPRPRNNEDADRRENAPQDGHRERERSGCPANDRPLELLV
jgi:hypothetical protein